MMQTLEVLNGMVSDGIISKYAVGGAVAAYNYVEATVTEDLDILVSLETADHRRRSGLITLEPILTYLAAKGYTDFRKEGLIVEGWPVQFLPVADDLDAKALEAAEEVEVTISPEQGSVLTRVLRPEHIGNSAPSGKTQGPFSHPSVHRRGCRGSRDAVRRSSEAPSDGGVAVLLCRDWYRKQVWRKFRGPMKANTTPQYPHNSDILARKAEARRELSALTFGEKIARIEALRERLSPFKAVRETFSTRRDRL
jgi:hypothetical protein